MLKTTKKLEEFINLSRIIKRLKTKETILMRITILEEMNIVGKINR
jgi:hypothetical protein